MKSQIIVFPIHFLPEQMQNARISFLRVNQNSRHQHISCASGQLGGWMGARMNFSKKAPQCPLRELVNSEMTVGCFDFGAEKRHMENSECFFHLLQINSSLSDWGS